jgi:nitrous oxide reductase accessory protein NosL
VRVFGNRKLLLVVLAGLLLAGCAAVQRVERPEQPFEIALLAVTNTMGELEPCG